MLQMKYALCWICVTAGLLASSFNTDAFDARSRSEGISASLQQPSHEERKVRVFDNEYLDRLFGQSRARQSSRASQDSVMSERQGFPSQQNLTPDRPPLKAPAEVLPNRSLLIGIKRGTPARRAAALRLAERGRTSLQNGQTRRAIYDLEKALSIDASPSIHFYLARAHYQVADYQGAQRFLDVAESGFGGQPEWVPELGALRAALSSTAQQPIAKRNVAWTFNE